MQRRRFILAACALAATSVLPGFAAGSGSAVQPEVDFGFRVGDRFRTEQGTLLEVSEVLNFHSNAHCQQCGVHFFHVKGPNVEEGTIRLVGPLADTELFLQPSEKGARAVLSRLT